MTLLTGVYINSKKDGTIYYRASITYKNKHISLGSYCTELLAHHAYKEATLLLQTTKTVEDYKKQTAILPFLKWVVLINFRENNIYFRNPIYLKSNYFLYYLEESIILKFDVDDLFFYSTHKIMKRGGYLFVSDYGMQINILSRYGIKNFAVIDRDYKFINRDTTDYRYNNIEIINYYYGVTKKQSTTSTIYIAKIHIYGDYIIGKYHSEIEAAIAYNKTVELLSQKGLQKKFTKNYISNIDAITYAKIYSHTRISKKIRDLIVL